MSHELRRVDASDRNHQGFQDACSQILGVRTAWADTDWAHYDRLPSMYRSNECHEGGELDLDEGSASFP